MIQSKRERVSSIDFIRGILVFLVILGHIWPGKIMETLPRYLIYSIHIPLFLGLSGFLVNFEKLKKLSLWQFFQKYYLRLGMPWAIAIIFFFILNLSLGNQSLSIVSLLKSFILPYYHLWYIQSFLIYITLTYVLLKISEKIVYIIATVFFLIGSYFRVFDGNGIWTWVEKIIIGFQLDNYIYLVIGSCLLTILKQPCFNKQRIKFHFPLFIIAMLGRFLMFFTDWKIAVEHSWYYLVIFIPLAMSIFLLINSSWEPKPGILTKIFVFIGQESLPIYLYHVFPLLVINHFILMTGLANPVLYWMLHLLGMGLFIVCLFLRKLSKIRV